MTNKNAALAAVSGLAGKLWKDGDGEMTYFLGSEGKAAERAQESEW